MTLAELVGVLLLAWFLWTCGLLPAVVAFVVVIGCVLAEAADWAREKLQTRIREAIRGCY
jgi:hypothetical protein